MLDGDFGADARPHGHGADGAHGHAVADRGSDGSAGAHGRACTYSGPDADGGTNAGAADPNPSNIDSNGRRPPDFNAPVTGCNACATDFHAGAVDADTDRRDRRDVGPGAGPRGSPRRNRAARQRRPGADRDGRSGAGVRLPGGEMAELIAGLLNFDDETAVVERVWKLLGLIGPEDSLVDAYTQSYQSSVVGFFQPSEDRIVVLSDGDGLGAYAELVYAHEYVHALQYGTYDIGALEEAVGENSDADSALSALVEGDASFLQQRYFQQHLISRRSEIVRTLDSFPEGPEVPVAISDSLIFPYVAGPRFVAALFRSGGWEAVDRAYAEPPQSTEHILHPEKYLEGEAPIEVLLPEVEAALGDGWERKFEDITGEFGLILLLETAPLSDGTVERAVKGWGGDRYAYYTGPDGAEVIAMLAVWDSEKDADEFFEGYADLLDGLGAEDVVEEPGAVSGVLRGAAHTIHKAGGETLLIIATEGRGGRGRARGLPCVHGAMNWLDIVITVAIVVLAFLGWRLGLLKSFLIAVGVIAAGVVAAQVSEPLAGALTRSVGSDSIATVAAYGIIGAVVFILVQIAGHLMRSTLDKAKLGWVDSWGGGALGAVGGFIPWGAAGGRACPVGGAGSRVRYPGGYGGHAHRVGLHSRVLGYL